MDINQALLNVIDELYAGALDHARVSSSLGAIARVMDASGGLMYLADDEHRVIYGAVSNFDFGPSNAVDAEQAKMLLGIYRQIPLHSVVHIHSLWPQAEMLKTSYYHDVLKRQDVMYGAASLVLRTSRSYGIATLNRSERGGPFAEADFRVLRLLAPHLSRVMQITSEMNALAHEREVFAATLDILSVGVILADRSGKLLHLNRRAEEIIAANDGLRVRQGRLIPYSPDDGCALERLIGQASGIDGPSFERGGICKISRPSGLPPYLLLVTPCSDLQARAFAPLVPACTIVIRDPALRVLTTAEELRRLFGLTHQESKVALGIAEGRGLSKVAEELGLSSLTVRNHLQRVFVKTHTSRQAELARVIAAVAMEVPRTSN